MVSVIIPAYNSEKTIQRAINSVLNQTLKDFELLIVDDGSTDGTVRIVRELAKKDARIRFYELKSNSGGPATPRNYGVKMAQGEYVAFLDHDDEWIPEKLEEQIKLFKEGVGIITCNLMFINDVTYEKGEHGLHLFEGVEKFLYNPQKYVFGNSSVVIKKDIINEIGSWDENLKIFEDIDYYIRIVKAGYVIEFVKKPLVKYYIHSGNLSRDFAKSAQDYLRLLEKHKEIEEEHPSIYAVYLRRLGTMYMLARDKEKSRTYFRKSIKLRKSAACILALLLSYLGFNIYEKVLNIKKYKKI